MGINEGDSMGESGAGMKPGKTKFYSKPKGSFGVHPFAVETNLAVKESREELKTFLKDFADLFPESSRRAHYRSKLILDQFKELRKKQMALESLYSKGEVTDDQMIKGAKALIKEYTSKYNKRKEEVYRK